jgi:hypothetical protein
VSGSHMRPDGSAELTAADLPAVLTALHIAAWWAAYCGGRDGEAARYSTLARTLRDTAAITADTTGVLPSGAIYVAPADAPVVAALVAEGAALDRTGDVQRVARALQIGGEGVTA